LAPAASCVATFRAALRPPGQSGQRLVAVPPTHAAELANLYAGSRYRADSNYVFAIRSAGANCSRLPGPR
jgi:hypothetical protein